VKTSIFEKSSNDLAKIVVSGVRLEVLALLTGFAALAMKKTF